MTTTSTAPKYKLNDQVNKKINTGVIRNPPPIPNNPDTKPTEKLKNNIVKIFT